MYEYTKSIYTVTMAGWIDRYVVVMNYVKEIHFQLWVIWKKSI